MLAKEIYALQSVFPTWLQVLHLPLTKHLPLSPTHCCLDTRPLKVIKKSLPSCAQRLGLEKQVFENRVRKITLSVKTLLLTHRQLTCPSPTHAPRPCFPVCVCVCLRVRTCAYVCAGSSFPRPSALRVSAGWDLHAGRRRLHGCGVPQVWL